MSNRCGLVVCGGQSTRMGMDKSLLEYHGQPQMYHLYKLLKPLCNKVYISCNENQASTIPTKEYDIIIDKPEYEKIGPMAALLSAFEHSPNTKFLVVGCDYPFIDTAHLKQLISKADDTGNCTSFYNQEKEKYEPLLSDYHYSILNYLKSNFTNNDYSIQQVLQQINASKVFPENSDIIKSIDTKEDYFKAKRILSSL